MARSKHPRGVSRRFGFHCKREKENGPFVTTWKPKERSTVDTREMRSPRHRTSKG